MEASKNDLELLGDNFFSDIAYQNGKNIELRSGYKDKEMDIILKNGFFEVEMDLKTCMGKSIFCYNSTDKMDPLTEMCFPGFCGFQVECFIYNDEHFGDISKVILNAEIYDSTETTTNSSMLLRTKIPKISTEKTEDATLPYVAYLYWNDLCCFAKKKMPLSPPDLNNVGVPQPKPAAEQEPKTEIIPTKSMISKESEAQQSNANDLPSSTNATVQKELKLKKSKPIVDNKKSSIVKKSSQQLPTETSESDAKRNPKIIIKNEKELKKEVQKKKPSQMVANKKFPPFNVVKGGGRFDTVSKS
uniref:Uncharacterized protein n=1 Tax=Panagrolaimus sp. PS1159 TaxID=55785 RepID=A0AC35FIW0_9BILA